MDADDRLADTRASYDAVAGSYAEQVRDALAAAPFLLAAPGLFAGLVHAAGADRWRTLAADRGTLPRTCTSWVSTPSGSTCLPR